MDFVLDCQPFVGPTSSHASLLADSREPESGSFSHDRLEWLSNPCSSRSSPLLPSCRPPRKPPMTNRVVSQLVLSATPVPGTTKACLEAEQPCPAESATG